MREIGCVNEMRHLAITLLAVAAIGGAAQAQEVTVMTRNIYLGASLDAALATNSPFEIPGVVSQTWAQILAANFPERAQALADEIAETQPHLIGLQEVQIFRIQMPGDYLFGNPVLATEVELDYLALLLTALEARGQDYEAVATTFGPDVEVPDAAGNDIRLTDREVILARGDVAVIDTAGANFAVNLELNVGGEQGVPVTFVRGWASVDATFEGRTIRFVSTHLEVSRAEPIQVAQGLELQEILSTSPHPIILVGDFNSPADGSGTPTYGNLIAGGFVDAFDQARPGELGYTCCHADDLLNESVELNRRIDHIFSLGMFEAISSAVVGDELGDRTDSGLWPSDHAGLVATLVPGITAVLEEQQASAPELFNLSQNYPNPFNSSTVIRYQLPSNEDVELAVYNLAGQKVAVLVQGERAAGNYLLHWDGRDREERSLASGVYVYRLQAGANVQTRKLVLEQ